MASSRQSLEAEQPAVLATKDTAVLQPMLILRLLYSALNKLDDISVSFSDWRAEMRNRGPYDEDDQPRGI